MVLRADGDRIDLKDHVIRLQARVRCRSLRKDLFNERSLNAIQADAKGVLGLKRSCQLHSQITALHVPLQHLAYDALDQIDGNAETYAAVAAVVRGNRGVDA